MPRKFQILTTLWILVAIIFLCGAVLPIVWPYQDSVIYMSYDEEMNRWVEYRSLWLYKIFEAEDYKIFMQYEQTP